MQRTCLVESIVNGIVMFTIINVTVCGVCLPPWRGLLCLFRVTMAELPS